jgi:iron complex outermembrane receptor protein
LEGYKLPVSLHFFVPISLKGINVILLCLVATNSVAQENSEPDSARVLNEVVVKAYATGRPILEVPASIGLVQDIELLRFSNTSLLPAVNTVPGVRMEERSPGSYRFSIRGSSLRSPFGVRNVKFYWNGLPLTDGGGNTYLNLLDFNSLGSMEIIKGPGSSLYGAGTGGVVLLQSARRANELMYSALGGSFGLFRIQAGGSIISNDKLQMDTRISYQRSDGYREQTNMNRFMAQVDMKTMISRKDFLSATFFATQLYYQTPGGLTLSQYELDPKQARPSTSLGPGAAEQQAAVTNNTAYTGVFYEHNWNENWSTNAGTFASVSRFVNPTIRNYEKRQEQNWGGRTETSYRFQRPSWRGRIVAGAEYQHFYSPITDYDNVLGSPGNVQTDDVLRSSLLLTFAQLEIDLPGNFYVTAGVSGNFVNYSFLRLQPLPETMQERHFDPVLAPRIAILKKISPAFSVFVNASSGFSPPTLAEVRPSTATFNNGLNAERGVSYEVGAKGNLFGILDANISLYDFRLNDAIVIQRDATGADYFVNAGGTSQQGIEMMVAWSRKITGPIESLRLWSSYTFNYYKFREYVNDNKDYSGNAVTGVAPTILVGGLDVVMKNAVYANITVNYTDRTPLNDANTDYASDYLLLGARVGYKLSGKLPLEFFAGVDNLLDQQYSLGNDLNATGGRYYNAAARINYYGGLSLRIKKSAE